MHSNSKSQLLKFTSKGIYCSKADVYIDPWKPVSKALITHGHADHARYGSKAYLCTKAAAPVIRYRLGNINLQTINFGESLKINNVEFSFHPAGHILGSAQIKVAYKGEIWVVTGDYKLENDGFSEPFESVKCHTMITESTFGLPVYNWDPQQEVFDDINNWWQTNKDLGKTPLLTAYSLGKAQRIIQNLDTNIGIIYTHGAIENINEVIRSQGVNINPTIRVTQENDHTDYTGNMVIAPPSAANSTWSKKFKNLSTGIASGWMTLRGARRRRAVERGFILSDHVDWKDLNSAVAESGASRVYVTHGYTEIYARYLNEQGYEAYSADTEYTGETIDAVDQAAVTNPKDSLE